MHRKAGCFFLILIFMSAFSYAKPAEKISLFYGSASDDLKGQRFQPVLAMHGMVSTQEAQASEVGKQILAQGGNAIDAAVAVGYAMAVTLPRAGNIGGGGFMLIWLADEQCAVAINYRETAPSRAHPGIFIKPDNTIDRDTLLNSYKGAGVPGTVAGLNYALRKYGTMSLHEVIQPAIKLARYGFPISQELARLLQSNADSLRQDEDAKRIFFHTDGTPLKMGETLIQRDLANTLEAIVMHGDKGFYAGRVADRIVKAMQTHDGLIDSKDLKNYQAQEVAAIKGTYRGYTIYGMPPPSSGGVTLIEMLNMLEGYPLKTTGYNTAQSIHLMTEVANLAFADRNEFLGDPSTMKTHYKHFLSKGYARELTNKINLKHHTPASELDLKNVRRRPESKNTTHYSIVDKDGNMVANTYTLNHAFGIKKMIPGAGFFMNNEMDDFTIRPGKPNSVGLKQGMFNVIAPGKQPLSSMAPTIVLRPDGKALLATGSPGSSSIITTVLQVIINVVDYGYNIATAVTSPRMHSQLFPDVVYLEQGFVRDTVKQLKAMGHKVVHAQPLGSAQTVAIQDSLREGAADPRRFGATVRGY